MLHPLHGRHTQQSAADQFTPPYTWHRNSNQFLIRCRLLAKRRGSPLQSTAHRTCFRCCDQSICSSLYMAEKQQSAPDQCAPPFTWQIHTAVSLHELRQELLLHLKMSIFRQRHTAVSLFSWRSSSLQFQSVYIQTGTPILQWECKFKHVWEQ